MHTNNHDEEHTHSHAHEEEHAHSHAHGEEHTQSHTHEEEHAHSHTHGEEHTHSHTHEVTHTHSHTHKVEHTHSHTHEEGHAQAHSHGEGHTHVHSHEHTKVVLNRLSRAIGHLQHVRGMVEEGRDCSEVLVQLAAVQSALNNTAKVILQDHMKHCIVDAAVHGDMDVIEELCEAIDRYF